MTTKQPASAGPRPVRWVRRAVWRCVRCDPPHEFVAREPGVPLTCGKCKTTRFWKSARVKHESI